MTEKRTPNPLPELSEQDAELLSAYIDDMLSPNERAELESHLEENAFLREELAAMQQTVAWVNQLPRLKAPRNFTISAEDLQEVQLVEAPKKVLRPNFAWTLAGTAAAVVIVLIGFSFVLMQSTNMTSAPNAEQQSVAIQSTAMPDLDSSADSENNISSNIESRAFLPTGTALPTQAMTSTALSFGVGVTAAAPIQIEIPAETIEEEIVAQEPAADEASESDAVSITAANSNQADMIVPTMSQASTQIAQAASVENVAQTATTMTDLFAVSPTMQTLGNSDGASNLAQSEEETSPIAESLAMGAAAQSGEDLLDDTSLAEATQEIAMADKSEESALSRLERFGRTILGWIITYLLESYNESSG